MVYILTKPLLTSWFLIHKKANARWGLLRQQVNKASLILQTYPQEACSPNEHGIYRHLLIFNWQHWGYPECDIRAFSEKCEAVFG